MIIGLKKLSMKMKNSLSKERLNIEDKLKKDSKNESNFIFNNGQNYHQTFD